MGTSPQVQPHWSRRRGLAWRHAASKRSSWPVATCLPVPCACSTTVRTRSRPASDDGFRCVRGGTFRLSPVTQADPQGHVVRPVDFTAPPANSGPGMIAAGDLWNFQLWCCDPANNGAGFNLSDGLAVSFCQ